MKTKNLKATYLFLALTTIGAVQMSFAKATAKLNDETIRAYSNVTDNLDETIHIQDWMSNEFYWLPADKVEMKLSEIDKEKIDKPLSIEPWMSSMKIVDRNEMSKQAHRLAKVESTPKMLDNTIAISSWMSDEKLWKIQ